MLVTLPLLLLLSPNYSKAELQPGVTIYASGIPIEVDEGHAAPTLFDINGDGKLDLVVGQFGNGRVRQYLNVGTRQSPAFRAFSYIRAGGKYASVPFGCCIGFTPQFVDLDGDGRSDMISGSYDPGNIYWFRNNGKGFDGGQVLFEQSSPDIERTSTAVFAVDWDHDGKVDFLVGNKRGEVRFLRNIGTPRSPRFGKRIPVLAGGKPIMVKTLSHPIAVDWDGDGKIDLLVGTGDGKVMFYRGLGRLANGLPKLASGVPIKAGGKEINVHNRAKIWVADWNGDGLLDLLVGNFDMRPDNPNASFDERFKQTGFGVVRVYMRKR